MKITFVNENIILSEYAANWNTTAPAGKMIGQIDRETAVFLRKESRVVFTGLNTNQYETDFASIFGQDLVCKSIF